MTDITFVQTDGTEVVVTAKPGYSVMEVARDANIAGIAAECGGSLACATCHVYLEEQAAVMLGEPQPEEADMLDFVAAERRPTSRLSCQVKPIAAMESLVVHIPSTQV